MNKKQRKAQAKRRLKESKFLSHVIGVSHTRHNYGDKLYDEEREKALEKHSLIDQEEKAKRLKKLRDMGMI